MRDHGHEDMDAPKQGPLTARQQVTEALSALAVCNMTTLERAECVEDLERASRALREQNLRATPSLSPALASRLG